MDDHARTRLWQVFLDVVHHATLNNLTGWTTLDLTMPQWKVLMVLHAQSPQTLTEIAQTLDMSLSSLTGVVSRLIDRQLVEKRPAPHDHRAQWIHLTPSAHTLIGEMQDTSYQYFVRVLQVLSSHEQEFVAVALQTLQAGYHDVAADGPAKAAEVGHTTLPESPL